MLKVRGSFRAAAGGLSRHFPAPLQGVAQGQFIGEFQPRARRQTVGHARDSKPGTGEPLGQVKARRLPLHIRSQGQDDFLNLPVRQAGFQLNDAQVSGSAAQRRKYA